MVRAEEFSQLTSLKPWGGEMLVYNIESAQGGGHFFGLFQNERVSIGKDFNVLSLYPIQEK